MHCASYRQHQTCDGILHSTDCIAGKSKAHTMRACAILALFCCPGMRLRFTKGINKAVILGMVDTMLANKVCAWSCQAVVAQLVPWPAGLRVAHSCQCWIGLQHYHCQSKGQDHRPCLQADSMCACLFVVMQEVNICEY